MRLSEAGQPRFRVAANGKRSGGYNQGVDNQKWSGGRQQTERGYVKLHRTHLGLTTGPMYLFEHRVIAERALGKPLPLGAKVHHVNFDTSDNSNTNLVICEDTRYHELLHLRQDVVDLGGDPNVQKFCVSCRELVAVGLFGVKKRRADGLSNTCKPCRLTLERKRNAQAAEVQNEQVTA